MSALQRQAAVSRVQREALRRELERREEIEIAKEKARAPMWQRARIAMENGTFSYPPRPRVPFLIRPDSPVSSAEQLAQLAGLESVPETIDATLVMDNGRETNQPVTICLVGVDARKRIEEKAVVKDGMGSDSERTLVSFPEQESYQRYLYVVTALKEGVKLGKEAGQGDDGKTEGADGQV